MCQLKNFNAALFASFHFYVIFNDLPHTGEKLQRKLLEKDLNK